MRAFIFPGQGSQFAGMGKELAAQFPAARHVFAEANEALGFDLTKLCFEGPEEELKLTANTQPAILTTSIARCAPCRQRPGCSRISSPDTPSAELFGIGLRRGAGLCDAVRTVRHADLPCRRRCRRDRSDGGDPRHRARRTRIDLS